MNLILLISFIIKVLMVDELYGKFVIDKNKNGKNRLGWRISSGGREHTRMEKFFKPPRGWGWGKFSNRNGDGDGDSFTKRGS